MIRLAFTRVSNSVDGEVEAFFTVLGSSVTLLLLWNSVTGFSCSLRPAPSFHHSISVALCKLLILVFLLVVGMLSRHWFWDSVCQG